MASVKLMWKAGAGTAAALVLAVLMANAVSAQSVGQAAADSRKQNFKRLGASFKGLSDELRRSDPSREKMLSAARGVAAGANGMSRWFPAGSGPQSGVDTASRDAIWTQPAQFRARVHDFNAAAAQLVRAVERGDPAAIRTQQVAVGRLCSACHESFRVKR